MVQLENIFADRFVGQVALCEADTLNQTLCKQVVAAVANIDNLIFDR